MRLTRRLLNVGGCEQNRESGHETQRREATEWPLPKTSGWPQVSPWPIRLRIYQVWRDRDLDLKEVFILEHLCLSLILKQRDGVRKLSLRHRGRLERPPWFSDNFVCRRWSFSTWWSEGIPAQSSWIILLKGWLLRRRRVVLYGNDVYKAINDILLQHQQVLFVLIHSGRRTLCPYIVGIVVVITIRSSLCYYVVTIMRSC